MNKDKRLAFILAPFLLIGGYVISDQYIESKANKPKLFVLASNGECAMFTGDCILQSGDMQINITDENGVTKSNTSYPVDTVAISLVYNSGKEVIYGLEKSTDPQYWERKTDIRAALTQLKTASTLRVLIKRKGSTYITEINPVTTTQ
ncbi:MAG: hypothetical protein DRQ44_05000 [Gammaproteobacteria bacterium]|nr:MAG: hypothetical protein DRQ44_05000 [Gammaproteobacteria bacterium]